MPRSDGKNAVNSVTTINVPCISNTRISVKVTNAIIEKDAFGFTFNACSSNHPPKMEYYKQAAINSGLEAPEFIDELKEWKIITSINLEPALGISIE